MFDVMKAKNNLIKEYDEYCEMTLQCFLHGDNHGKMIGLTRARCIADIMKLLFDDDFLVKQAYPIYERFDV